MSLTMKRFQVFDCLFVSFVCFKFGFFVVLSFIFVVTIVFCCCNFAVVCLFVVFTHCFRLKHVAAKKIIITLRSGVRSNIVASYEALTNGIVCCCLLFV
jgi:hypothetical protein